MKDTGTGDQAHAASGAATSRPESPSFAITADELGALCSFDERDNHAHIRRFVEEFGGVREVARRLKSDLVHGLVASTPGAADLPGAGAVATTSIANADAGQGGMLRQRRPVAEEGGGDHPASPYASSASGSPAPMVVDKTEREAAFGVNIIPPPRLHGILELVWTIIMGDPILKVLIVGGAIVLGMGTAMCPKNGFIEGVAILCAVLIVLVVTAGNDYVKGLKFRKLLLLQSDKRCKVVRSGIKDEISSWDVLVGDVIALSTGDEVPADGIFVSGVNLQADESPLTGETLPVKKHEDSPFLFSGSAICQGTGFMIATGIGVRSTGGQIQTLLNSAQSQETALQSKLRAVAVLIGKVGLASGIVTFIVLTIRWAVDWSQSVPVHAGSCGDQDRTSTLAYMKRLAENFVIGITIVVLAVPEGLPLAVTMSLAFSMFKMMQDNCFVRHLGASETMGQATCVCTDKTGTLTENRMTVVKVMMGTNLHHGEGSAEADLRPFQPDTLSARGSALFAESVCTNSTCFLKQEPGKGHSFIGSPTEGAMLVMLEKMGISYEEVRAAHPVLRTWEFTSERKRMSCQIATAASATTTGEGWQGGLPYRLHSKGASEIILERCDQLLEADGTSVSDLTPSTRERIASVIQRWAGEGLRTVAVAYKDTPALYEQPDGRPYPDRDSDPEQHLVFLGLVGIKDPIRKEVPEAVRLCQRAGLVIRMVTGDNLLTASKIARECNILTDGGLALEGPVFRAMSEQEKIAILPRMQVLARSSPTDKYVLVSLLKKLGEVVAVTGDGTNDAPAMKEADVGFAMGISGTQIALNASDIVLLDDNFVSIVQSLRWGRNVMDSVRKFLQFQFAVNIISIFLTFIGSAVQGESPLNTVQLLWVNLVMDTLGALALATDDPDANILLFPPQSRKDSLITWHMYEYMGMQVVFQTVVLVTVLFGGDRLMPADPSRPREDIEGHPSRRVRTMVFLLFILCQLTNLLMTRQLSGELNVFHNMFRNPYFLVICALILAVQVLLVIYGGVFMETIPLYANEWILCVLLSLLSIPFVVLGRLLSLAVRAWWRGRAGAGTEVGARGPSAENVMGAAGPTAQKLGPLVWTEPSPAPVPNAAEAGVVVVVA